MSAPPSPTVATALAWSCPACHWHRWRLSAALCVGVQWVWYRGWHQFRLYRPQGGRDA